MNVLESTPLVAIKCLVYNHEPYLRQCLDGFVMQKTNFPFVAIIHDDASTDGSATIIREYAEKYPDIIKPIYETENQYSKEDGSLSKIVDVAINATGAKYIAICEGDDYWTCPEKLQKQVEFMERNETIGLCYTDYSLRLQTTEKCYHSIYGTGKDKPIESFDDMLFSQGYIAPPTWIFKRSTYNSVRTSLPLEALDITYCLALEFFANSKVSFLPIDTATYRSHPNSACQPLTQKSLFKYRRGVYFAQSFYAERYLKNQWILQLLKTIEMYELVPLAMKIGESFYIDECEKYACAHKIDFSIFQRVYFAEEQLRRLNDSRCFKLVLVLRRLYRRVITNSKS